MILKNVLLVFLGSTILFACSNEQSTDEVVEHKSDKQIVAGKIPGAAGKTIKLMAYDGQKWNPLSAYEIKNDGAFHLTAPNELLYCQLVVDNTNGAPITLGGTDSIYLTTGYPDMSMDYEVSNVAYASTLNEYLAMTHEFIKTQKPIIEKIQLQDQNDTASINGLVRKILEAKKPIDDFSVDFIKNNPASPLNQILAAQLFPSNGFQFWDTAHMKTLDLVLASYQKNYPEAYFTKSLEVQIPSWKGSLIQYQKQQERLKAYGNMDKPVEIGNLAPDIILDTPDGEELRLSSLRGQYVLIDFWASWCGPCRRENPNVVRLYHQYKDKGFTVYSVSLDDNMGQWKEAIQRDGLVWPNHVSDLTKWNSIVVKLYKFNGIPHTVLIDKTGKIIAKNLRGAELERKLFELFGK